MTGFLGSLHPVLAALAAGLFTWGMTAAGASRDSNITAEFRRESVPGMATPLGQGRQ